jgi:hypothetical protein
MLKGVFYKVSTALGFWVVRTGYKTTQRQYPGDNNQKLLGMLKDDH